MRSRIAHATPARVSDEVLVRITCSGKPVPCGRRANIPSQGPRPAKQAPTSHALASSSAASTAVNTRLGASNVAERLRARVSHGSFQVRPLPRGRQISASRRHAASPLRRRTRGAHIKAHNAGALYGFVCRLLCSVWPCMGRASQLSARKFVPARGRQLKPRRVNPPGTQSRYAARCCAA